MRKKVFLCVICFVLAAATLTALQDGLWKEAMSQTSASAKTDDVAVAPPPDASQLRVIRAHR